MENNNQSQQTLHSTPLPPLEGQGVGLSMVQLWQMLERTEKFFKGNNKRFCPRSILKLWCAEGIIKASPKEGGLKMTIFDVCQLSALEGYEELPRVRLYPRKHRELLRAIIAVTQGIGMRRVDTRALDDAFSIAFPRATPINVNKKRRERESSTE